MPGGKTPDGTRARSVHRAEAPKRSVSLTGSVITKE